MGLGQPVWSRVDEAAHYDVIAQYAHGVYPHDSVTAIRDETLEVMIRTDVYGFVVDNEYARPDLEAGFQPMPSGLSQAAQVLWIRRHGFEFSYEAFQPPLYYVAALPAWAAGNALGGAIGAVYGVRIFDALLAALLAPLVMLIVLRIWPVAGAAAWGAVVLTAVLPGVALNLTSVTNDVLVTVLGAVCLLVAIGGEWTRRRVVAVGLLFGAALLTKTTAIALVPALALVLLNRRRGGGVRPMLSAFAISAACIVPWLISNLVIYGELITTKEQVAMAAFPPRTADPGFWSVSTLHSFVTFWSGDPFLSVPGAVALAVVAALLTALGLAGLWRALRSGAVAQDALRAVALAAVGAAVVAVSSPVLAAFNAPGRLAYVALAGAMALVAIGLWHELRSPRLRWAAVGTFAGVAIGGQLLFVYSAVQPPARIQQMVVANKTALGSFASFEGLTVQALSCVVDTSNDIWIDVRMENGGTGPIEWTQHVEVQTQGGGVAVSDFRRSTPFPVSLAPGRSYTGWLWLGPATTLRGHADPRLVFKDLAADSYTKIGDLVISTPLC
jgi:hypothetical protein